MCLLSESLDNLYIDNEHLELKIQESYLCSTLNNNT